MKISFKIKKLIYFLKETKQILIYNISFQTIS